MLSDDPAAPEGFDPGAEGSATAASRANFGAEPQAGEQFDELPFQAEDEGPPTLAIDAVLARDFLQQCMTSQPRVKYGLGDKVPFHGAVPGRDFTKVDCSGFVRELMFRSTTPPFNFRDGSVVQHDWVRDQGFARGTISDAKEPDGVVRIAFLSPQDAPRGVGHVVVVHNGTTMESHGGVGPNTLPWTGSGWQSKAKVFVLTP